MRILLLADNWVGWQVTKHLRSLGEHIVGLIVHPPEEQHYTSEIIESSGLIEEQIMIGEKIWTKSRLMKVERLKPDIVLVIFWAYLLPDAFFSIASKGCINFHLSYLPYNRGKKPNVWPIIDDTPAGVTMHYIDVGIDTGPIVTQKRVEVDIIDTGKTLYYKLLNEFVVLFQETWPRIKEDRIQPVNQQEVGTFHWGKEFYDLDLIDLNRKYTALEIINLLRARTFRPHPSAYFIYNGRKVYVRVDLEYGEEI